MTHLGFVAHSDYAGNGYEYSDLSDERPSMRAAWLGSGLCGRYVRD